MGKRTLAMIIAVVLSLGIFIFAVSAGGSECYTCTSASTGKCKDMMYCKGSYSACKAAGCVPGSSSATSCPTSANYKAKTCTP